MARLLLAGALAALFSGCGGGGSSTPPAAPTSVPLLAAYKARITAGANDNYVISGSCGGSATLTASTTTPSTFEGVPGYQATQTATINLTGCTPASSATTAIGYYDANYMPIGAAQTGTYAVYVALPATLPATGHAGDTAVIVGFTTYTDSTKAVVAGHRDLSYVIEADSASTLVANLITKEYNASGQLLFTQQSRYRVDTAGAATPVTIDVQYATTSTLHLVFTKT